MHSVDEYLKFQIFQIQMQGLFRFASESPGRYRCLEHPVHEKRGTAHVCAPCCWWGNRCIALQLPALHQVACPPKRGERCDGRIFILILGTGGTGCGTRLATPHGFRVNGWGD